MKHGRMKLVTFGTEECMEEWSLHQYQSMNSFHKQEQKAGKELEMARAGGRRKYIA
jgi:hypothetical protein